MNWIAELFNTSDFIVGVFIGLVIVIGVEELSLRISAYIQQCMQSNTFFEERLDSGISMILFGLLLFSCTLIGDFSIRLDSISDFHLPTLGVVVGGIALLLGVMETVYLVAYKIPKFNARYDVNFNENIYI
jgi:hypothetical protein